MTKILVTGAAGQIGSELVPELRKKYGNENVVAAGSGGKTPLPEHIRGFGPHTSIDVTDYDDIDRAIKDNGIKVIYHMPGILSKDAEEKRMLAFKVNYLGLFNVLEAGIANKIDMVIVPSSIAALGPFGENVPRLNTPNDHRQRPRSLYGIAKVNGEMWADHYSEHEDPNLRLDVRGVRFPGLLTTKTLPNPGGTTDYANYMVFDAVGRGEYLQVPLEANTVLPMMYMPDAVKGLIMLAEADRKKLRHHGDFNISAYSFTPAELAEVIKRIGPEFGIHNFQIGFMPDPVRQKIANGWTEKMDDDAARTEWGWKPDYDLETTVKDMIKNLKTRDRDVLARHLVNKG